MKMNYDENLFTTSADKIYNGQVTDTCRSEDPDVDYIDIFNYENLVLECNFSSGKYVLYLQKSDTEYEILYECSNINGIENSSFYSKNNVFILTDYNHNTSDIRKLDCIPKKNFIEAIKRYSTNSNNKIFNYLNDIRLANYSLIHSIPLISEGKYISEYSTNVHLFQEYRKLFVKYRSAITLIPISNILDEIISSLHEYIATGKFDIEKFNKSYLELQNYSEICSNSISLLYSFIQNPRSTNLQNLCDDIGKNLKNVENLIDLYLEEELNMIDKENSNDCK